MLSRLFLAAALVVVLDQRGMQVQGPVQGPVQGLAVAPVRTAEPWTQTPTPKDRLSASEFARLIERLSEPNGYFDTDNLISNEASYLHVIGKLRRMQVTGGAYLGVGPDQNFSYIAQIRPRIAFIVDIRRDNLVEHLLFKA